MAAAVVLFTTLVVPVSLVGPSRSAAAAVLTQAANAAASQPPLPALGAGQYYYQANIELQGCTMPIGNGPASVHYESTITRENWVAADGTGSVRLVSNPGGHWQTPQDQAAWQAAGSPTNLCAQNPSGLFPLGSDAAILSLPADPKVLGSLMAAGQIDASGEVLSSPIHCALDVSPPTTAAQQGDVCSTAWQFDLVNNLLASPIAVNKLGPVLYRILSQLPGVELLGPRTDGLGRTGTAIEEPVSGYVVVLDPSTGTLLETQSLVVTGNTMGIAPGTVAGSVTFGPIAVASSLGTPPSQ